MDPRNLHRAASDLFRSALDLEPEQREAYLETACSDQPDLLSEVLSLLEHHAEDSFLDGSKFMNPACGAPPTGLPTEIGRYRIQRMLGWGGSGVVYLATQNQPHRQVALKVLRADLAKTEALLRFRRESELLARLDHPGIARVMESGEIESPQGTQAFIAMEYIAGEPLLDHARNLDHRGRLELAAELAVIVEHAHSRGIVHRDLKPANILIRTSGQPTVLDFGIARQVSDGSPVFGDWTEIAENTVTGQLLGTLAYMSPEQATGDASAIDARTDVYALGVILFELVSGKLPYDTRDKLITEAIRMIERGEPTPLSHYGKSFAGDLETIVEKAMRKERARRYETAGEMAEDLHRLLDDRPILARPPSRLYRARKFLVRHRRASFSALSVIAILLSALLSSLTSLRAANKAELGRQIERAITVRFADEMLLDKLIGEAEMLWPASPEELPNFEAWLARAERLAENHATHVRDSAGSSVSPPGQAELVALRDLIARLEQFLEPKGLLETIHKRCDFARNLKARTVEDYAGRWTEACSSIASPSLFPLYQGLEFTPQIGLIPLGPDPDSGLWEFALFGPTGSVPERNPETGRLNIGANASLVLVLIPGGEFLFGAQPLDSTAANFDPSARDHEGPPERVELDPFFMGKYEWTQAQWIRIHGANPSYYAEGDQLYDRTFTSVSPVESVNWTECMAALSKLGLTLPTETQWEYSARAGSGSVFWSGDDTEGILASSNLGQKPSNGTREDLRMHGPVGLYSANKFGLYDTAGNVSEWCLDVFKVACRDWPLRPGDGLRLTPDGPERVRRGGSWAASSEVARSARRDDQLFYLGSAIIGFRAARSLDR